MTKMNEEEICKLTSAKQVRRTLEELAMTGDYHISHYEKDFVVYAREKDGMKEELTGQKVSDRTYRVIKRVRR